MVRGYIRTYKKNIYIPLCISPCRPCGDNELLSIFFCIITSDEPKEEEEIYVTKEQATVYVSKELGISDEMAEKVVASIDKNDDGKIANKELLALRDEINTR